MPNCMPNCMPKAQITHKMYTNSAPFQGVFSGIIRYFQVHPFNTQQPPVKHPLNSFHRADRMSVPRSCLVHLPTHTLKTRCRAALWPFLRSSLTIYLTPRKRPPHTRTYTRMQQPCNSTKLKLRPVQIKHH